MVAEPPLRGDEIGGATPRKRGVPPGDRDLALRLGALLGKLRRLDRAGEGHFRREVPAGAPENLAAQVQGAAVRLEREGAVQRQQRPVVFAQPVGGVAGLVPDHGKVGVSGGRLFEGHEPFAVASQLDEGGAFQRQRKRGLAELVGRLGREGQRLLEAALTAQQLEVLAPGQGKVGLAIDELEVRLFRLIERCVAKEVPRPGQGTLTGLGDEHAELGGGEHVANVPAGPESARGAPSRAGNGRPRARRASVYLSPVRPARNRPLLRGRPPMDTGFVTREQDRLLGELFAFLRIPSVSTLPQNAADCRRAADWLMTEFKRLKCSKVELLEGKGHPIVWAESPRVPGKPTVLVYGHYDVQPVDPLDEWVSPPFEPTIRDGKLFARGAVDDKGQVFCLLKAYEAVLDATGKPPLNVNFIIEGEEECGGHVIVDRLKKEPERTRADAVLVADMSYYAPGIPAVYTALRGMCYAEIHLRTLRAGPALRHLRRGGAECDRDPLPAADGPQGGRWPHPHPRLYDQVVAPTASELDGLEGAAVQRCTST